MLTGFGPFVTVDLAAHGWTPGDIGLALSVGTFAAVLAQLPAGALVDAVHCRRALAGGATALIVAAALVLAWLPQRWPVFAAQPAQGLAASLLTPAIAAITLALSDQERLGERLGSNVRFKALGSMMTALLMGVIGSRISNNAVFFVAAAFGGLAIGALWLIRPDDLDEAHLRTSHPTAVHPRRRKQPLCGKGQLCGNRALIGFGACAFTFQLANAALFPFAITATEHSGGRSTAFTVSAALVVSQAIAAALSPWIGRVAERRGRRIVLVAGFAMLPLRAALYALIATQVTLIVFQALDGLSAAMFGVMVPLVVADITHRGGRFNLAMGMIGFVMMLGATLSTFAAGFVAQRFGFAATFLALGAAGGAGVLLVLFVLPETDHLSRRAHAKDPVHAA
jgi:MFS family permease